MNSTIKIIKRNRNEDANDLKVSEGEKSVEQRTREMVSTVKHWIAELQEKKRAQVSSFPPLPVIAAAQQSEFLNTPA
jgi:hypothetical protein